MVDENLIAEFIGKLKEPYGLTESEKKFLISSD
jgi:hypothetical protein